MVIKKNTVADIYYHMRDEYGNIVDSNEEYSPLQYLHGYNNIIPSLENALEGLRINEEKYTTLNQEGSFGKYDSALVVTVNKSQLGQSVKHLEGGIIESEDGQEFRVISIINDKVTLDGNHPLAGKILDVFVKVVAVREGTPEEIKQGRPLPLNPCCGSKGCC